MQDKMSSKKKRWRSDFVENHYVAVQIVVSIITLPIKAGMWLFALWIGISILQMVGLI